MANMNGNGALAVGDRNPVQIALENYNEMAAALASAEDESKDLRNVNQGLLQECQLLRENYETMRREFLRVQAFSVALSTRLSVIQGVVAQAIEESAKFSASTANKTDRPAESNAVGTRQLITEADLSN